LSAGLAVKGLRGARPRPASGRPLATDRPARLLVVGATGGTGRHVVAQALERGHAVTAFARDPSRLATVHPNLRVVQGDVLDAASLEAAVRDQDAVVSVLGHRSYYSPARIQSEGTRNLLRAMEAHGVTRLVCVTSLGLGDSAGRLGLLYTLVVIPLVLPLYFWDKARQERLIASSRVDWIVARPGALTDGPKTGAYRHGPGLGGFLATAKVSRADVADFLVNQIGSDAYVGSTPGICG
jgi:putative NADH-flavin reductase